MRCLFIGGVAHQTVRELPEIEQVYKLGHYDPDKGSVFEEYIRMTNETMDVYVERKYYVERGDEWMLEVEKYIAEHGRISQKGESFQERVRLAGERGMADKFFATAGIDIRTQTNPIPVGFTEAIRAKRRSEYLESIRQTAETNLDKARMFSGLSVLDTMPDETHNKRQQEIEGLKSLSNKVIRERS